MKIKKSSGFTLIEILTVIVILGVLAGLAVPVYVGQVEKARGSEAIDHLNAARASMIRGFADKNSYADLRFSGGDGTATFNTDYNPNTSVGGQAGFFDYTIDSQSANAFTLKATRKTGVIKGVTAPTGTNTITLTQDGTLTKVGAYA